MIKLKNAKIEFSFMTNENRPAEGRVTITGKFDNIDELIAGITTQSNTRCEAGEFVESLMITGGK